MGTTWKTEVICPYCHKDITRMKSNERINHKLNCHILHNGNVSPSTGPDSSRFLLGGSPSVVTGGRKLYDRDI